MNFEANPQSLLTFRVGPVLCCAPSLPVRSIIKPPKLTHPPGSGSSQPGIFKHGSHIVKVLDLRNKFGIDVAEQTQPGNLIITIIEEQNFAFWVDQILDVFDFPSAGWGNLPSAIPRGIFTRTLLLNKKIHLYSEFEKLATINDLGYLKHYIRKLKQQDTEQQAQTNSLQSARHEQKKTVSEISTDKTVNKTMTEMKSDEITDKPNTGIKKPVSEKVKQTSTTAQSLSHSTVTKAPEKERDVNPKVNAVNKPSNHKKTSIEEKIQSTTITRTPAPNVQQQATPKREIKTQTHFENKIKDNPLSNQTSSASDLGEETESYLGIIFLFMFILCCLGTGIYYLLSDNNQSKGYKYKKEKNVNSTELNYRITESYEPEIYSANEHTMPIQNNNDIIFETTTDNTETNLTNIEDQQNDNSIYQANITQHENEITITLQEPASNIQHKQKDTSIPAQAILEAEVNYEKISKTPQVKILKKNEISKSLVSGKVVNEVIHTVIKGDTLWAIAKKYVNDPFLYPELARLSKINNPHRIYPGNRVRIRFIKR